MSAPSLFLPAWMTSGEFPRWLRSGTVLLNSCQLRRVQIIFIPDRLRIPTPMLPLISHARVKSMWIMANGTGPEISQKAKAFLRMSWTPFALNCLRHSCSWSIYEPCLKILNWQIMINNLCSYLCLYSIHICLSSIIHSWTRAKIRNASNEWWLWCGIM